MSRDRAGFLPLGGVSQSVPMTRLAPRRLAILTAEEPTAPARAEDRRTVSSAETCPVRDDRAPGGQVAQRPRPPLGRSSIWSRGFSSRASTGILRGGLRVRPVAPESQASPASKNLLASPVRRPFDHLAGKIPAGNAGRLRLRHFSQDAFRIAGIDRGRLDPDQRLVRSRLGRRKVLEQELVQASRSFQSRELSWLGSSPRSRSRGYYGALATGRCHSPQRLIERTPSSRRQHSRAGLFQKPLKRSHVVVRP